MTNHTDADLIAAFHASGKQATICPTKIVLGSPQLARHLKPRTGFMARHLAPVQSPTMDDVYGTTYA